MFLDTAWLAYNIPRIYIPPVEAYRTAALEKIPPVFDNLEQEAESVTEAEYERLSAQPADPYWQGDLGDLAERATEYGNEYGETMFAIRQSVLNLLAVGLQHLFEQQQKGLYRQTYAGRTCKCFRWKALNESLLLAGVNRTTLPGADKLEELRLAANTIKHGSGPSAAKLAAVRPDLFDLDPGATRVSDLDKQKQVATMWASELLFAPLGGGDLYVTEKDLEDWCEAVLRFWRGLASSFRVQHSPDSEFP